MSAYSFTNREHPGQSGGGIMHPQKYMQRKMLNAPEAAAYCGSSASTFAKLRLYGGGPRFVKLGRRVVYDPIDLDEWLTAHRHNSPFGQRWLENLPSLKSSAGAPDLVTGGDSSRVLAFEDAINVANGGKADMGLCTAHVCF
jgi:predicted DNA-binding transcriptional regulator AlpA